MTANKDLKRIIRRRMRKTGESYTAARRHFLNSKDLPMTEQVIQAEPAILDLSIDHLQLTLKTARQLRRHGIERIGQLVEQASGRNIIEQGCEFGDPRFGFVFQIEVEFRGETYRAKDIFLRSRVSRRYARHERPEASPIRRRKKGCTICP